MKPTLKVAIDIIASVVYIICANPLVTGLAIHEWLSLGIVVVFIVHVAVNFDLVLSVFRAQRANAVRPYIDKLNLALNVALIICFMVVTVSGIMISNHILPTFGLYAQGYWLWMPVHTISAKVFLALLILHIALHIKWFLSLLPRKGKVDD
jgi:hypothetical protein